MKSKKPTIAELKELVKHLSILVENKEAFIGHLERQLEKK